MKFYLKARPHMQGQIVELLIYRGAPETLSENVLLGTATFDKGEWEAFRHFVVGGMRVAGHFRVAIALEDGTRRPLTGVGG